MARGDLEQGLRCWPDWCDSTAVRLASMLRGGARIPAAEAAQAIEDEDFLVSMEQWIAAGNMAPQLSGAGLDMMSRAWKRREARSR
jgi:hypothetical protein